MLGGIAVAIGGGKLPGQAADPVAPTVQESARSQSSQQVPPQNVSPEVGSPGGAPADSQISAPTVTDPRVKTSPGPQKQPPVNAALDLPFAPEPQRASALVLGPLTSTKPAPLQNGVTTPVSTGQPLPLSLDDAVRLGLEYNLQARLDQQTVRQVSGVELLAFNALIPSLTAVAESSAQEINLAAMGFNPALVSSLLPGVAFSEIVKVNVTQAQMNVSQQLFNLPAYEEYRAAKQQATSIRLGTLGTRAAIVENVATQYLRALADEASIRNAESQVVSDRELERQASAKKDAGVGTNLDLLRATVDRQQREQELIADQNSLAKDKIQLNRMMGLAADQPLELTDPVPYHELDELPLATATQVAYKRRKDLLSLEAQMRSQELQRRAVRYERFPAAKVSGYYGVLGETTGLYHGVFTATGAVDFPIFEEARIRGDRDVADAALSSTRAQLSSLRADIEQQIRSSMLDISTSRDALRAATSNVSLAEEQLAETQMRYKAGVDDTLPVVRAQATLAGAQSQFVNALFQFNGAKLQLARNTGVLEAQYDTYLGN